MKTKYEGYQAHIAEKYNLDDPNKIAKGYIQDRIDKTNNAYKNLNFREPDQARLDEYSEYLQQLIPEEPETQIGGMIGPTKLLRKSKKYVMITP